MTRRLFINARIYPDGIKEILDGAILSENGKIKRIYYDHPQDIEEDTEIIDLKGLNVLPSFVRYIDIIDTSKAYYEALDNYLCKRACFGFIAVFKLHDLNDLALFLKFDKSYFKNSSCLGFHLDFERGDLPLRTIAWLKMNKDIISLSLPYGSDKKTIELLREDMPVFLKPYPSKSSSKADGYWELFKADKPKTNILIEAMLQSSQRNVNGTVILELRPLSFSTVGVDSKDDLVKTKFGEYGEMQKGWTAEDAKGFIKVTSTPLRVYYANHKDEEL